MARVISVEINGVVHPVLPGREVTLMVEDGTIRRKLEFSDNIGETILSADDDELDSASSDYEDIHTLCAADYEEEDEEEGEDEEFDDEELDEIEDDLGDEDEEDEEILDARNNHGQ